ncbi:sensor domain-containing protein [Litchfieldia salsa]|uniref:PAS domain S-box-containing protein/diguanylate cyclase (GGDEF) domain-containing protein n=1 Tax=Litchfieldia salsa TaxID=930152 RepID=A0A1H0VS85_9BACI|nr:sensor domain-containing diguanylate cyclase [Litchfieldia salsa]SDP81111.1 PAS domain S-box-containing protein/diguanylate cyclase (GGDEF) domain-containing protein [Litchfieldia salsa]
MEFIQELSTLTANEPQLRLLIDMVPEFIVLKDGEGRWLVTNKLVLISYGMGENYPYQGKTERELLEIFPQHRENFIYNMKTDEMAWDKREATLIEKSFKTPDGTLRTWEVIKTPIFDKDGNRSHLIVVSREITHRKRAEESLKISESNYRLIAENMKDIILTVDGKGTITYLSPSFEKITGYSSDIFINNEVNLFSGFIHPDHQEFVKNTYRELIFQGKKSQENYDYQFQKKDGQYIWLEANINTIYNDNGEFEQLVLVARDIIQRKEYQSQLETMAYHDHLTNIPNRRYFMDKLSQEMTKAEQSNHLLALMYLDIDHFKDINDRMGHHIGDQMLIQLVRRIQNSIRDTDVLARLGGDEFAIILPRLESIEQAKLIGERIVNRLKKSWRIEDHIFQTTSSIGIAIYQNDGTTPQDFIRNADQALYTAKERGKALIHFYN